MKLITRFFCAIFLFINSPLPVSSQFWHDHGTKPVTTDDSIKAQLICTVPTDAFLRLIDTSTNTILRGGTMVSSQTFIMYACSKNTRLIGEQKTNFCHDTCWIYQHPRCLKMCPPIFGHTITALCTYKNKVVPCNRIASPGTIAKISCAVTYENPSTQHKELHCQDNGEWNHTPFECQQVCGTIDKDMTERGSTAHKVPWHVALYLMVNNRYEHICGGTLIKSKIVISAAHCVWDSSTNTKYTLANLTAVVGKFYRDYYANEDLMIQESNISKIDVPTDFGGHTNNNYLSDIAILTLTDHIEFTDYIRPACLIWKTYNEMVMQNNKLGVIAGWGKTYTGTYSTELRSVEILSIDYQSCTQIIPTNFRIANDKFCVENTDTGYICQGDGGGGFLVAEDINNDTYYNLWGIVSNALIKHIQLESSCNKDSIIAFTNIQWYKDLIMNAISDAYTEIDVKQTL